MFQRIVSPAPRSGHVAVAFDKLIIIWGGFQTVTGALQTEERYIKASELAVFHIDTRKWMTCETTGDVPDGATGCTALRHGPHAYLVGGHTQHGNTNTVHRLHLPTCRWKYLCVTGGKPSPRDKSSGWVHDDRLYIFGGYGPPIAGHLTDNGQYLADESTAQWDGYTRGWNNQLFVFDLASQSWSNPACTGNVPSCRAAHSTVRLKDAVYLFGGRHGEDRLNDLYRLDLATLAWDRLSSVAGDMPEARSWHTLTPVSHTHLFLYAGFSQHNEPLGDAWMLDVVSGEWRQLSHTKRPRLWHTASQTDDGDIVVFGGCTSDILADARHTSDLLVFRFSPKALVRLSVDAVYAHRRLLKPSWSTLPSSLHAQLTGRVDADRLTDWSLGPLHSATQL